jgi:hypothetical protein
LLLVLVSSVSIIAYDTFNYLLIWRIGNDKRDMRMDQAKRGSREEEKCMEYRAFNLGLHSPPSTRYSRLPMKYYDYGKKTSEIGCIHRYRAIEDQDQEHLARTAPGIDTTNYQASTRINYYQDQASV